MVKGRHIALVGALLLAGPALATEPLLNTGETLLEVQATGEASAVPSLGQMSIGVVSTGTTAREATSANAVAMAKVIAAVRTAGVEARFIRTEQINVQPRFARSGSNTYEEQAQITGYVARNTLGVRLTRLAIAPDVITAAFGAGANTANGPTLGVADDTAILASARHDALARARVQAETYADGLGMKIGRILRVSERGHATGSNIGISSFQRSDDIGRIPDIGTPVAPGTIYQTVSLWIDYALVPK